MKVTFKVSPSKVNHSHDFNINSAKLSTKSLTITSDFRLEKNRTLHIFKGA